MNYTKRCLTLSIVVLPLLSIILLALLYIFFAKVYFPESKKREVVFSTVELEEGKIHYYFQSGDGPPLVFLHGFGGDLSSWASITSHLKDRKLYALDLMGFGASDRPAVSYSLEFHAKTVSHFMESLNIRNAVLVGQSMGGSISSTVAANYPERVDRVVLISPSGVPGSIQFRIPMCWSNRPGSLNRILSLILGNRVFSFFFPHSLARQELGVTASYNDAFVDNLTRIPQKTRLLWSTGDYHTPLSYASVYLNNIHQSTLVELPTSCGHRMRGCGFIIAEEIRAFLSED